MWVCQTEKKLTETTQPKHPGYKYSCHLVTVDSTTLVNSTVLLNCCGLSHLKSPEIHLGGCGHPWDHHHTIGLAPLNHLRSESIGEYRRVAVTKASNWDQCCMLRYSENLERYWWYWIMESLAQAMISVLSNVSWHAVSAALRCKHEKRLEPFQELGYSNQNCLKNTGNFSMNHERWASVMSRNSLGIEDDLQCWKGFIHLKLDHDGCDGACL